MVGYQLDDEPNLMGKWLEITKPPLNTGCLEFQVLSILDRDLLSLLRGSYGPSQIGTFATVSSACDRGALWNWSVSWIVEVFTTPKPLANSNLNI